MKFASIRILALFFVSALFTGVLTTREVRADLVGITYWDRGEVNPATNGGPLWQGVVDTVANTLRIDSWRELPQHGAEFWVPGGLSGNAMIWTARDATGAVYDVPDTFGPVINQTVSIGDNFAFIAPLAAQNMSWFFDVDGDGNAATPRSIGGVAKPTRIGWGGYARQETVNGPFVFYTSAIDGEDSFDPLTTPPYDERNMPRLPVEEPNSAITGTSNAFLSSLLGTNGTVLVSSRETNPAAVIVGVPEPSGFLCLGLVGTACALLGRKRR
ncbi:MAG: hypothetical protein AAGD11_00755 [Planctomycetota bacterium]